MLTRLRLLLLCLLFFLPQRPAAAQAALRLAVRAGFDGYCAEGHWLPVEVVIENPGQDLELTIQAHGDQLDSAIYTQTISLPAGSTKTATLQLMPERFTTNVVVRLVSGESELAVQTSRLDCLANRDLLVGVISSRPAAFDLLAGLDPPGGRLALAVLDPGALPDQPGGLDALDLLFIAGADTGGLTPAQLGVLHAWIASGGQLFVAGGPEWQSTLAGLSELLPGTPAPAQSVAELPELAAFAGWNLAPGPLVVLPLRPDPGATLLAGSPDLPLLLEKRLGDGRVIYSAADPSLAPLADWSPLLDFYARLFSTPRGLPSWGAGIRNGSMAEQAVANINRLSLPPVWMLSCFLGIYILLVGPLNFVVLRRLRRPELAWFSIPLISLLFAGSSYVLGWQLLGARPWKNELAIVQVWPGASQARLDGMLGIFSPQRRAYDLQIGGAAGAAPLSVYPIPNSAPSLNSSPWRFLLQPGAARAAGVQFDNAGLKGLAVQGLLPAAAMEFNLKLSPAAIGWELAGVLHNTSGLSLEGAVLLGPGLQHNLGTLAAGENRQVRAVYATPVRATPLGFNLTQPYSSVKIAYPVGSVGGWNTAFDPFTALAGGYGYSGDPLVDQRYSLLNALHDFASPPGLGSGGYVYLAGWSDQPVIPLELLRNGPVTYQSNATVLYIFAIDLVPYSAQAQIRLAPGDFLWQGSSSNGNLSPAPYEIYLDSGELNLSFIPALPLPRSAGDALPLAIAALDLRLISYGASGSTQMEVALWDFSANQWQPQPIRTWGTHAIEEPARYVSPSGEIRLRLESQNGLTTSIEAADISLTLEEP